MSLANEVSPSSDENSIGKKRCRRAGANVGQKEHRKAANRRAAHESRLRKKQLIEKLLEQVRTMQEELSSMKQTNQALSKGLEESMAENRKLRFVHLHVGNKALMHGSLGGTGTSRGLPGGGFAGWNAFSWL